MVTLLCFLALQQALRLIPFASMSYRPTNKAMEVSFTSCFSIQGLQR